jgi:hypothetical protein
MANKNTRDNGYPTCVRDMVLEGAQIGNNGYEVEPLVFAGRDTVIESGIADCCSDSGRVYRIPYRAVFTYGKPELISKEW